MTTEMLKAATIYPNVKKHLQPKKSNSAKTQRMVAMAEKTGCVPLPQGKGTAARRGSWSWVDVHEGLRGVLPLHRHGLALLVELGLQRNGQKMDHRTGR